jgi:hypothetical protein
MNVALVTARPRRAEFVLIGLLAASLVLTGVVYRAANTTFVHTSEAVPAMTVDAMTRNATVIVTANVTGQSAELRQGSQRAAPAVLTHTAFAVLSQHKGAASAQIVVTTLGGRLPGVTHIAEDEPTYALGDRVILFLGTAPDGSYYLVGAFQGSFLVRGTLASNGRLQLDEAKLVESIAQVR